MKDLHSLLAGYEPLTVAFVTVILVITILATLILLAEAWTFSRAQGQLKHLRERLETPGATPLDPDAWMQSALADLPPRGHVRERLDAVYELSRQNADVPVAILSDLAVEKSESTFAHSFARFALLTLLIIGLAGTFLALSTTLRSSHLDEVASGGTFDAERYQQAMRHIYTGFGGAFFNSICAIGGTVWLLLVQNVVVKPLKDGFFNALDTFTQVRLLPFCLGGRNEPEALVFAVVSKLEAVVTYFGQVGRQLGEAVSKSDASSERLGDFSQSLAEAVGSFTATVGSQSGFQMVMERLYDSIGRAEKRNEQTLQEFSTLAATVQEESVTLVKMQGMMVEFQQRMLADSREFMVKLAERQQRASDSLTERHQRSADALTEQHRRAQSEAAAAASRTTKLLEELRPALATLQAGIAREDARQSAAVELGTAVHELAVNVHCLERVPAPEPARVLALPPLPPPSMPSRERLAADASSTAACPLGSPAFFKELRGITDEIRRALAPAPRRQSWLGATADRVTGVFGRRA